MVYDCVVLVIFFKKKNIFFRIHSKIETVEKQNIPIDSYSVTTDDGYVLKLYNIPPAKNKTGNGTNVIFLMHGLFSYSASYVLYPKESAGKYCFTPFGATAISDQSES